MDIRKEAADNHPEAITGNRPGGMLTTGTVTEVLASHEDATTVCRVVQHEALINGTIGIVTPVTEEIIAKETLLAGRRLQETGRDNLVGVHILQRKGHTSGCYNVEFLFHNSVLGSVITPVTAAAAATKGEQRIVRLPGP